MKTATHGNGNGLNDAYILPETTKEQQQVIKFLNDKNYGYSFSTADVKGHEWYGKRFINVPFGEGLVAEIKKAVQS